MRHTRVVPNPVLNCRYKSCGDYLYQSPRNGSNRIFFVPLSYLDVLIFHNIESLGKFKLLCFGVILLVFIYQLVQESASRVAKNCRPRFTKTPSYQDPHWGKSGNIIVPDCPSQNASVFFLGYLTEIKKANLRFRVQ